SCCASAGAAIPRSKDRTAVRAIPITFIRATSVTAAYVPSLAQASCRRVYRVADSLAGYEKFDSPVLLSTCCAIVRGYSQGVAETSGSDRIHRDPLLHQVVTY